MAGDLIPKRSLDLRQSQSRAIAKAARPLYEEVRIEGLKIDGSLALAGHAMEGLVELDQIRRTLAGADEVTNKILAEIELEAVRQVKKHQGSLFNEWGM